MGLKLWLSSSITLCSRLTHLLAVVDLTIAEQSEMRVLMQLHGLHPIQAVYDFQTMETDNRVLRVENILQCDCFLQYPPVTLPSPYWKRGSMYLEAGL
jgi:hypothetical protein